MTVEHTRSPYPTVGLLGNSGCGKDESGLWLAAHTPLRFVHSTSWYLAPHVALRTGLPVDVFRSAERHRHKEAMYRVGREIRAEDPGVFIRDALAENDIISGVRDPEEVVYLREHNLVDLVVWLDRDVPEDPTMRRFGSEPWRAADVRLDNTGSLAELYYRLARLARALRIPVSV